MASVHVLDLRGGPAPDAVLAYGPGVDQVVDLRLPPDGAGARRPVPLVVVVHGGFWRPAFDRTHAAPQATALAAEGYVVAVPEYRRSGWPGTFDDTASWSDGLVQLVEGDLGPGVIDPDRVVLVGHSAGAHLALWSAGRHLLPAASRWHRTTPLRLRAVVALGGVCDLALSAELDVGEGATAALLDGDAVTRPDRYREGDPAALVPSGVPTVLLHGAEDTEVPPALSRSYAARAREAGGDVELLELPGTGHYDLIDPRTEAWTTVIRTVSQLSR